MRKHQTWLWSVIVTLTIASFLIFFLPNSKMDLFGGGGGGGFNVGTINGRKITREEYRRAQANADISSFLRTGEWMMEGRTSAEEAEHQIFNNILIAEKLRTLNINVSTEAATDGIANLFGGGEGRPMAMENYKGLMQKLAARHYSPDDFEEFFKQEIGQEHLSALFGMSGKLVSPKEAEQLYRSENESMSVDVMFFPASNYLSQVTVEEKGLSNYFQLNRMQYHIPDQRQIAYVKFDATNFYAKADEVIAKQTNLTQMIMGTYQQKGGTNYFKDANGRGLTLDEATPKIKEMFRSELAIQEGSKVATEFLTAVYDQSGETNFTAEIFDKVAAAKNLKVNVTQPIDERINPKKTTLPINFLRAAFSLTEKEPFLSSSVPAEDGVYAISLRSLAKGRDPELKEVQSTVTDDYKMNEARKMARIAGEKFANSLSQGMAEGRKFESLTAEAKVKALSLPPFSLSTRSLPELNERLAFNRLQEVSEKLPAGKSSEFVPTEDGGVVVHMRTRTAVSDEEVKRDIVSFTKGLSDQRAGAAFQQWAMHLREDLKLMVPTREPAKTAKN